MSKVVGIDLGTTNSLVAYVKDGVPEVIRDEQGDALVPSVVSVGDEGAIHVGREAERRLLTQAQRTAYSVKRFMGKGREDVQHEAEHFPFRVSGEAGGVVRIGLTHYNTAGEVDRLLDALERIAASAPRMAGTSAG